MWTKSILDMVGGGSQGLVRRGGEGGGERVVGSCVMERSQEGGVGLLPINAQDFSR